MKNYRNLNTLKNTYNQGELSSNPLKNFFKRLGRKLTFWYIHPFGERQNGFNKEAAEMINELADRESNSEKMAAASKKDITYLMEQIKTVNQRLAASEQRGRALFDEISRIQNHDVEFIRYCDDVRADMNEYIRSVNPQSRKSLSVRYFEAGEKSAADLTAELLESEKPDLEEWGEIYRKSIMQELERAEKSERLIAVICMNFRRSEGIEAIRGEALELYALLKKSSPYSVKFISIEPALTEPESIDDILYIPSYGAGNIIKSLNPVLCVFCESTPHIILADNCSMLLQRSVLKLSGQNPLQGVPENAIKELTHLNDFGIHKYLVQSETAARIMLEEGFHEPVISYPVISPQKVYPRKRVFRPENFTIGFASSPMENRQLADRGVNLLCSVMKNAVKFDFRVLWRYNSANVPDEMYGLKNCKIIYGKCDMQDFYSSIDCLVIPYESIDSNHACSLSAVEAMQNGIPVLCTEISGISEIVRESGIGEISAADTFSMISALEKISSCYDCYSTAVCRNRLDSVLDNRNIVDLIEREAEKFSKSRPVTLYEWDRRLKLNDKYLVKGHKAMKEYYQQQEIADKYTQDRFTSPALKYFDFIERKNIGIILDSQFPEKEPDILDAACGDGRITSECIKHGCCTSADASIAMLNIVEKRFEADENKPEVMLLDIISEEIYEKFDAVTCFRYIRHFEYPVRRLIYRKIRKALRNGGIMIIDVPNIDFELPLKRITGWENYNIYDVFWSRESIEEELRNNGFRIKYLIPTGQGLMKNLPENVRNLPMTWTIGAVINS